MAINRAMFAEIDQLLNQFPELHDQNFWETDPQETGKCGTTRCVAGWAVWLAARDHGLLTQKRQMVDIQVRSELVERLGLTTDDLEGEYYEDAVLTDHPVLGGILLGLTAEQAHSLFHDFDNDRVADRVESYAKTGEDIPEEEWENYWG